MSQSNYMSYCRDKDEVYCEFIFIHPLKTNIMKKLMIFCGLLFISLMSVTKASAYQDYYNTYQTIVMVEQVNVIDLNKDDALCVITSVYNWGYLGNVLDANLVVETRCNSPPKIIF